MYDSKTRWIKFYKEEFLPIYKHVCCLRSNITNYTSNDIFVYYSELVDASCTLIKYYLAYNGLFQFSRIEVLREAFYIEFIEDGDIWSDALALSKMIKVDRIDKIKNLILVYLQDEQFIIFDKLSITFKNLVGTYE